MCKIVCADSADSAALSAHYIWQSWRRQKRIGGGGDNKRTNRHLAAAIADIAANRYDLPFFSSFPFVSS
jgi:hypothetical protein